jgi:hypothetical protein
MVDHASSPSPADIGAALAPIRAAIDVVASGTARSVTIHDAEGRRLLPAARALARAEGLTAEPIASPDHRGCDIRIRANRGG